jgi:hypothetical protein
MTPTLYENCLAMRNTADMTGSKPISALLQPILGAINPLVTFYDIHGGKREVLFFYLYKLLELGAKNITPLL